MRIAAVFCLTLAAYARSLGGGQIWNDTDYVTKPALRSLGGLWRIWTELGATEQYYPLLHSFFWLQHKLWGDAPLGYHLVNVLLHATAACLVALVVERLLASAGQSGSPAVGPSEIPLPDGPPPTARRAAWIAAALFALHPVMVESVAWISEQKNTLSTVFYLAAALVYLRFDKRHIGAPLAGARPAVEVGTGAARLRIDASARQASDAPTWRTYIAASALFACALLSKSVTATLPAALLVAIWWQRGRIERRDVAPLLPWFAAGIGFGLFSAWVEHTYIGARGADFELSLLDRGVLAGRIVWFYLGKLAWPVNLIFIYPRWQVSAADAVQWVFPVAAIALGAALYLLRHKSRAPLTAYLYFVGTLFPTLGFFNVYAFKFSFVADHWLYLPSIGLFVLAAGAAARLAVVGRPLADAAPIGVRKRTPYLILGATALLTFALLGAQTWRQQAGYHDMETFYRTIIARNSGSYLAQYNLAELCLQQGRIAEAEGPLLAAIRAKPTNPDAYENLGVALLKLRRPREAVVQLEEVFKLRAPDPGLHQNTGAALAAAGEFEAAIRHFREAIRLDPKFVVAYDSLARALDIVGRPQEALQYRNAAATLTTPAP